MEKRIRRFYNEIDEVLGAINVREDEFYRDITENEEDRVETFNVEAENNVTTVATTWIQPVPTKEETLESRREDLEKAIKSKDVTKLENAIEWAKFDGLQADLREEIYQATRAIRELSESVRIMGAVRDLRQSVISELRSYTKPPRVVHTMMLCTYLLLGMEKEKNLKRWEAIRSLLGLRGKNNLKTLVAHFDQDLVDQKLAARVRGLLAPYDLQTVCDVSEGAAVFYAWLMEMIQEPPRKEIQGETSQRLPDTSA